MANESRQWLYNTLKSSGLNVGASYDDFDKLMDSNEESRKWCYEQARRLGHNVGKDYNEFNSLVGPSASSEVSKTVEANQQTIKSATPQPVQNTVAQTKQEQQPKKEQGWKPSAIQQKAFEQQMQKMNDDFNAQAEAANKRLQNVAEYSKHRFDGQTASLGLSFNPETGKMQQKYMSPSGNVYFDKATADADSYNYRQAYDTTIGGQLRKANKRLADLQAQAENRRQELIKQWEDKVAASAPNKDESWWTSFKKAVLMEAEQQSHPFTSGAQQEYMSDQQYRALQAAINQCEQNIQTLRNKQDQDNGVDIGFWRGFGQTITNGRTWDFGINDLLDAQTALYASDKAPEELSDAERAMMEETYSNQQVQSQYGDFGFRNRAGDMTAYMFPFMTHFAATSGGFEALNFGTKAATKAASKYALHTIGKEAIADIAQNGVKQYIKKEGVKGATKLAGDWLIKATGTTADELLVRAPLMSNTIQSAQTSSDIINRKIGNVQKDENGELSYENDKRWRSAIWQGEANSIIENYSEMFGTHLDPVLTLKNVGRVADTFGAKRLGKVLATADAKAFDGIVGTVQKQFEKLGVSDYFGEVAEEYYGQLWRTALNLDDAYQDNGDGTRTNLLATGQFHGDIWGGMALSMGMMGAGKYGMSSYSYAKCKSNVNKADKAAATVLPDSWNSIRLIIDSTDNENIGELAESIMDDQSLTDNERAAIMDYMEASMVMRGENLADIAQSRAAQPMSKARQVVEQAYTDGNNANVQADGARILQTKKRQTQKMLEAFGVSEDTDPNELLINYFGTDDTSEIVKALYSDENITSDQRAAIVDYLKAESIYDGMMDGVESRIKEDIHQSEVFVDTYHNKTTNMMQPAKLRNGSDVYVVDGNVQLVEDGSMVDLANSDHDIFVYDPNTGVLESTDAANILTLGTPEAVADAKARRATEIREKAEKEAQDAINGSVNTTNGSVITIADNEGTPHQLTVVGEDEEGKIVLTDESGNQLSMTFDELQSAADEYKKQELENEIRESEPNGISEEAAAVNAEVAAQPVPRYTKGHKAFITIKTADGKEVYGRITGERSEDDENLIEVYTDEPIQGRSKISYFTAEELDKMIVEYDDKQQSAPDASSNAQENGAPVQETQVDEQNSEAGVQAEPTPEQQAAAAPEAEQQGAAQATYAVNEDAIANADVNDINSRGGRWVAESAQQDPEHFRNSVRERADLVAKYLNGEISRDEMLEQMQYMLGNLSEAEREAFAQQEVNIYKPLLSEQEREIIGNNEEENQNFPIQDTENGNLGTETANNNAVGVENVQQPTVENSTENVPAEQQTPLQRVPTDAAGKRQWTAVDSDTAWDGLVEKYTASSNGDQAVGEQKAKGYADNMVDIKSKALKKAERAKTKPTEDEEEWERSENERLANIAKAKQELEQWQRIANTKERRDAAAREAAEAEARRKAAEKAEAEEAAKAEQEKKDREEREALNGVPDWNIDKPADARARGFRRFGPKLVHRQQAINNAIVGKEVEIKFTDKDRPKGNVVVIEAEQLQPSHLQGQRNPYHFIDEAQPKERNDKASVIASQKIANDIRPEEITGSVTAYTGAPTINDRGEVIQGNNRADALRLMWESFKGSSDRYKQYLIDHASEFGLDPEAIANMQHPVLVNRVSVNDDEAIALGQHTADETESGGIERIKAKNTAAKLGHKNMREYASRLLAGEDDASFAELVAKNGVSVIKWLNSIGAITNTQAQSAFNSNGTLTGEAVNDLKDILYQSIFTGAPTRLAEMFDKLPAKAQKAILATAFRDFDSRTADRMIGEIQQSIIAYNALLGYEAFANAKNIEEATRAIEGWKRSYVFDDVSGESYLPDKEFSNFALQLAAMYKTQTQSFIQATFKELYDVIQGAKQDTLFEIADKTPKSLKDAIKKVLDIDYNGNDRNNVLDSSNSVSEEGQQGSDGNNPSGEQSSQGDGTPDHTGGADIYNQSIETSPEDEAAYQQQVAEEAEANDVAGATAPSAADIDAANEASAGDRADAERDAQEAAAEATHPSAEELAAYEQAQNDGEDNADELEDEVSAWLKKQDDLKLHDIRTARKKVMRHFGIGYGRASNILRALGFLSDETEEMPKVADNGELRCDNQGNPIDVNGKLIIEDVNSISEITDEDFENPTRTIGLPELPDAVQKALSTNGKKVIIKKNIFERNGVRHDELTPEASRAILEQALYNPSLYGKNRPLSRPNNWIVINVQDGKGHNKMVVLEISDNKDNIEIVHWLETDAKGLTKIRKQAEREDGQLLILPSENSEEAGALSSPTPDVLSDSKGTAKSDEKQEDSKKNYTLTPTTYTNKANRTSNVIALTFDHELTAKQKAALKAFAKEPLDPNSTSRYKKTRGWENDKEKGEWLFRTEEDARKAGEMVSNEDAVEDNQPLSIQDLKDVAAEEEKQQPESDEPTVSQVNIEGVVNDLKKKGKAKLSDHATPVEDKKEDKSATPYKSKYVNEEDQERFAELRAKLRKGLLGRLNAGFPADLLPVAGEMAYLIMKHGARKINEFGKVMIEEIGDAIRAHIPGIYEFTRYSADVQSSEWANELSSHEEVDAYHKANIAEVTNNDPIATAEQIVATEQSQQDIAQAADGAKKKRNELRHKQDEETAANTEALAEQSEALASQVESQLEAIEDEETGNQVVGQIDQQLDAINEQLALLGYYEAEENDKDFNEAFGYMRNAEKKAVKDAEQLGKRLAHDLGIDLSNHTEKKGKRLVPRKLAKANIALAGGDITIKLPLAEGRELVVYVGMEPVSSRGNHEHAGSHYSNDNLEVAQIMYRVENPNGKGYEQYGTNRWAESNVTYADLLKSIQREAYKYLPEKASADAKPNEYKAGEKVQYSPDGGKTWHDAKYVQYENGMHRLDTGLAPALWVNASDEQIRRVEQPKGKSADEQIKEWADQAERGETPFTITPEVEQQLQTVNGYKIGDKVLYKGNKAEIYQFEKTPEGLKPVLAEDGLAPVIYTIADWNDIKPADNPNENVLEQAERIANAEEEKEAAASKSQKQKKEKSTQDNQPIGDLFGGLFDEQLNTNNNEEANVQSRTSETQRGGRQSVNNEKVGASTEHEAKRTDGQSVGGRSVNNTRNDQERSTGVSELPKSKQRLKPIAPEQRKNLNNNHAERGVDYAPKGVDARIRANIAAIELMQKLVASGEKATEQQKEVLRKFSGWGGLGKAFNDEAYSSRIKSLMSAEEYDDAVMSRNSAYYTPASIIDKMWDIARAMGFKGGNVLEGSAGIGNILGLMPSDFSERSNIQAVELDRTTGNILALLYPDANVNVQGFETTRIQNGSVDLAITNVPFVSGLNVKDNSGDKDLSSKFRDIHDFCIAKNVRKLRDGGIGIFITSNGTLDNSTKLREWLVNEGNADVVGAFRLNNETFGGAAVTSDIIVVRKRVNGRKSAHAIDVSTVTGERTVELKTGEFKTVKGKGKVAITKPMTMTYNKYFIEHPECMAGEMQFAFEKGATYRESSRGCYPVKGKNQEAMMSAWVDSFQDMEAEQPRQSEMQLEQVTYDELGDGVKEGSMLIDSNGNLCVAQYGKAVPLRSSRKNKADTRTDQELIEQFHKNKIKGHTRQECFTDYCKIKEALANLLKYQTENQDDRQLQPLLNALNKAFDDFVERYGNFHKNNQLAWLRNDMDYPSVVALESFEETSDKQGNKTAKFGKTDIFTHRVVDKEQEPKPSNTKDGIIASIYKYGRIDMPYLAEVLGRSEEDIKREIIESGLGFENPVSRQMEVSYEYLSGNVREKLRQAKENNANGEYNANIHALERIIPDDIPAHLIEFTLGSSWVEPSLYEEYIKERTGVAVRLKNVGGTWFMNVPEESLKTEDNRAAGVVSEELGVTKYGHQLLEAALQNKTVEISKMVQISEDTSEKVVDKEATAECSRKIDEFRADFKDWARSKMQSDTALSERIEHTYNEQFNNYVAKSIPDDFVPDHFGGAATVVNGRKFKLRPHQSKAAIRATTQSVLLAHEVGTGKTYTLITAAMEMRRLGEARKPMIVVQNATVGQFVASAKALYPNAKILTLEDADRNAEGRKNFYAKIRYNDWDMIVVPQSVFEKIPDSEERQMKFVQDRIEEKMRVLEQMKEEDPDGKSFIVRQAESELAKSQDELKELTEVINAKRAKKTDEKSRAKTKHNAEVKALEMLDRSVDDVENFDDMGIDALLVDEAHEYKHLGFSTAMQRGVKGVDPSYSKKAQGVFLKTQSIMERKNGRNVVFATGTPISNTAAEIWTFMRYLMPADTMKEYGIYYFDDFVRNFGDIRQMLEFATNGRLKENNRFAGYVNLPELVRIWSGVADTVLTKEAGGVSDKIPEMQGGKAQDIYLPQTKALRSVMKFVNARLAEYEKMSGKEKKANSHIPLTMYGIAKAAAVDARLVVDGAEDDPNSKTNEAVRQTLKSLEESKSYKGTVAIFADNYQNSHTGFNLYDDIRQKLIEQGVDPKEIVVMRSDFSVKKKLDIFDKVNRGEVRVILGSTFTLGTGVNIQERLYTLIHIDAPNRPMDYTQRNGRILRQGNIHKEMGIPVKVLRFGVEDSLDVTAYQRLKTKGAIADSIMNGKKMLSNNMENRSLEEDEDVFGDITAQLSGSEYAMLKNQAEREVRKLSAQYKQWQAQQTYIHNQLPRLAGQNKEAERLIAQAKKNLDVLSKKYDAKKGITVNGVTYPDIEAMAKLFTEINSNARKAMDAAKSDTSRKQESKLTINVGGIDFTFTTTVESKLVQRGQNTLDFGSSHVTTYSCEDLGLSDVPVSGGWVKSGVEDILQNVVTGEDFNGIIESQSNAIERNNANIEKLKASEGKPFEHTEELKAAEERLRDYEEKMKAEMAEKEAKYAQLDSEVEEAADVQAAEEAEEESNEDNSEGTKDTNRYRIREDVPPTNTGIGYKVFYLDGNELYPPMVANANREATPTGVFLDADANEQFIIGGKEAVDAEYSHVEPWLRRYHVKAGGKGTQGGSGELAYRPGWHLGTIPYALQFNRIDPVTGEKKLFPKNFVWAEVEYANDVDYQTESDERMWYDKNGKRQNAPSHALGGLNHVPTNGAYTYRTNPNPETDPWIITGAMRVRRLLTPSEVDAMVEAAGRAPQEREAGAITDEQIKKLNHRLEKQMDTSSHSKSAAALQLAKKLGMPVRIVTDVETLTHEDAAKQKRMRNAKGWFDTATGEVVVVLPNNRSVQDIEQTVFHEIVGHKALRELIGEEKFNDFLDAVYEHASKAVRERITALAIKNGWDFREATEEYMAQLAEKGFEDYDTEEKTFWQKVRKFIDKILKGLNIPKSITINDNDIRYMLWRGYQMQIERGAVGEAQNVVKKQDLGTGEFKFRDGANSSTPLSLEATITQASVELAQRHKDSLKLRNDAISAVGGNLTHLRQAMARQKEFDINTVKSVSDLAKTLMDNGWFDELSRNDIKGILSIVKDSVGKQDITEHINKIMGMMIESLLKKGQSNFAKLMTIKGSKVNAQGVEVQGELDADGAKMVKAMKAGLILDKDTLEEKLAEAMDRMDSEDEVIADEAALEYAGLSFALQYHNDIKQSVEEEKMLKDALKKAAEDYKAGQFGSKDAYDQFVQSTKDAIRQNKIERVEAYQALTTALADALRGSIENAKTFKQAEKERIRDIQHSANSDMQGRKSDEHRKDTKAQKFMNSSFVRFFLKPLATFDQMFRMFGNKSQNGEGYLWNRFVRGWVDCTEKEYQGVKASFKTLDDKVSQVFHKKMKWSDLYSIERKMKKGYVAIKNGGDIQEKELTQGNMLYIYMANKMADGKMKLRKMGITEEDVERLTAIIDPRFIELADWMQDEFLTNKRSEYNQVYKRMFGTSMAAIENYFPLKILSNARSEKTDVADAFNEKTQPSTITGSVIKRRRNALPLDITGADAFSVVIEHIQQMEKWAAFAEYNRDLNTLLSYKRFRNQVQNMSSVYGSGKKLWNNLKDVCRVAAGTYHPAVGNDSVDATVVNMAKGVTKAKIAFRVYTAMKQLLSAPAFLAEANMRYAIKYVAMPWTAWNWAMKELPMFEKRWKSRQVGDTRLTETDMDWKFWKSNFVKKLDQWGMSPNAFVDALTIAVGSRAIYDTKYKRYIKQGYSHEWADQRAKQDAAILYNESQQSNENAFLSTMQLDRSLASVALSVFRNSSMGYQRQLVDAVRNLKRVMTPGYREQSIEFMAKQHERNGLDADKAKAAATSDYNRGIFRDLSRVAVFGFVMQMAWNLGAYLPYLIGGGDDDDKDEMKEDAVMHALLGGSVEGFAGGNILSEAINMVAKGESLSNYDPTLLPLFSDAQSIWKHFENDKVAAANDIVNLLIQSGFGVNPQTLTDMAVAIWDACGDDARTSKEATLCIMRVLNCPQSQIDKIYFDELGCNGTTASKLTPKEIAERYATYKVKRAAALTEWAYSDDEKEARKDTYRSRANSAATDKLNRMGDREINDAYLNIEDETKAIKQEVAAINTLKYDDISEYAKRLSALASKPEYIRYRYFERYDSKLNDLSKRWLAAKTPEEKAKYEEYIIGIKRALVEAVDNYDNGQ